MKQRVRPEELRMLWTSLLFFLVLQLRLWWGSLLKERFSELGPELYRVINPCKLTNLQHLVAVLRDLNLRRQVVNILRTSISPTACSSEQESIVILSYIFLNDFTAFWKELLRLQLRSVVVWSKLRNAWEILKTPEEYKSRCECRRNWDV
jgi:hypothetical protein